MSRWMRDAVERCIHAGHEWLAKDDPEACADCLEWAMASAYRAGREAALREAAKKCDERMESHRKKRIRCGPGKRFGKLQVAEDEAFACAADIRTLRA